MNNPPIWLHPHPFLSNRICRISFDGTGLAALVHHRQIVALSLCTVQFSTRRLSAESSLDLQKSCRSENPTKVGCRTSIISTRRQLSSPRQLCMCLSDSLTALYVHVLYLIIPIYGNVSVPRRQLLTKIWTCRNTYIHQPTSSINASKSWASSCLNITRSVLYSSTYVQVHILAINRS